MKRKNIVALITIMLTVFYAVAVFSVYQSEMNSTKGWYACEVERVYDKGKANLRYLSDVEYFEDLNDDHGIEPKKYDFRYAMSKLTRNFDYYEAGIPTVQHEAAFDYAVNTAGAHTVELEAVFDSEGNIVAMEGEFYDNPIKFSESDQQTSDKQLRMLVHHLKNSCSMDFDISSMGVQWTTGDNCCYTLWDFEYNSEQYYYFSGMGLDFVRATLGSEIFAKTMIRLSVCYAVLVASSLILLLKKKEDSSQIQPSTLAAEAQSGDSF